MKAPVESALVLMLGALTGVGCAGTWIGTARAGESGVTDSASPGACKAAIARLETALNEARTQGRVVASAPQSVGAMLHHQPTRDSVRKAEIESVNMPEALLATARDLRCEGKCSECVSMLKKIALPVGIR
jgi:hypothetical protein